MRNGGAQSIISYGICHLLSYGLGHLARFGPCHGRASCRCVICWYRYHDAYTNRVFIAHQAASGIWHLAEQLCWSGFPAHGTIAQRMFFVEPHIEHISLPHVPQVLKKMFNLTNYKSAPHTVMSFWSSKSARRLQATSKEGWFEDVCRPVGLLINLQQGVDLSSPLIAWCMRSGEQLVSFQHLSHFQRGRVTIKVGEWVLCSEKSAGSSYWVGRVVELAQCHRRISNYVVRMRCDGVLALDASMVNSETGSAEISRELSEQEACMCLECVVVSELHVTSSASKYTLTW